MRGVSPIVSTVLIVVIVFGVAALVSPWMMEIATNTSAQTGQGTQTQFICQNTAYDFDTTYGTYGVDWNFTGTSDTFDAIIINTGNQNLYNFSVELIVTTTSGPEIVRLDVNSSYQHTSANPLKPGQSAQLKALVTSDITGTLTQVKILNGVCPSVFLSQNV